MSERDSGQDVLAARFEEQRPQLRAVAYRMLGSLTEADDAVQEAWLRLTRGDAEAIENLGGWLTTVVSRVCLNVLRARANRREEPLETYVPDPVVGPEEEAVLADSVSLALLVVLDQLSPAERLAFVLHDLFAVPFDQVARIADRTPAAVRQLASRARRRVHGVGEGAVQGETAEQQAVEERAAQRAVVEAFVAASRGGDFDALIAVLDPDVVIRTDGGASRPSVILRGVRQVARGAMAFARVVAHTRLVTVNGGPGAVALADGEVFSVAAFTIRDGRIAEMDILADPDRLARLDLSAVAG